MSERDPLGRGDPLAEAVDGWTTREPPRDFADRVMPPAPGRWPIAVGAAAAALVLATFALLSTARPGTETRHQYFERRASVSLGSHGTLVAEAGSEVEWTLSGEGARVDQRSGAVFYRVEPGRPFSVHTPTGTITVAGTCFSVEIEAMKSELKGAAVGALVTAAVWVTVFEGRVAVANAEGEVHLEPGERGRVAAGEAPRRVGPGRSPVAPVAAPAQPATQAATAPPRPQPAGGDDAAARVAELEQRAADQAREIERLKAVMAEEHARLVELEGEPITWPDQVPERYTGEALRASYEDALAEAGFDGEVTEVDCAEFPCIVYGKVNDDDGSNMERLQGTEALSGYSDGATTASAWGGTRRTKAGEVIQKGAFSIAAFPKEADSGRAAAIKKRVEARQRHYREASLAEQLTPEE